MCQCIDGFEGGQPNIPCAPTSGVTLSRAHYERMQQPSACAVLTELRSHNGIKTVTVYAGLPATSKATRVLAPLMPPEVENIKPAHGWVTLD